MAHGHSHAHSHGGATVGPASRRVRVILGAVVGVLGIATLVAVAVLWPRTSPVPATNPTEATSYTDATITAVAQPSGVQSQTEQVQARLDEGPDAGTVVALGPVPVGSSAPLLQVGDRVVVTETISLGSDTPAYAFVDLQRRAPLWLLAAIFAAVVIGVARWRGLASLAGLAITWLLLVHFVLPAILAGESPVAVAVAGSALIMFVVLYLSHGVNARTTTALIGTLVSLTITGVLATVFVDAAHLSGLSSDEATFLANSGLNVNLSGLLLAGIIIGSLGVLNDVTVTQASAVWEVHAADPDQTSRRLYRSGMRIGRDHIASTVYTLVLAYAGASLPLLVLFVIGNQRLGDIVTTELVAEEVIRTLIGSIGLVLSVPLTTFLASIIAIHQIPVHAPEHAAPTKRAAARRTVRTAGNTLVHAPASVGAAMSERRSQRRSAKAERAAKRVAEWEAPAAEREFWGDDT